MSEFYAIIYGTGEGCDYTVGCNVKVIKLDGTEKWYKEYKMNSWDDLEMIYNKLLENYGVAYTDDDGKIRDVSTGWEQIDSIEIIETTRVKKFEIHNTYSAAYKDQKIKKKQEKEYKEYMKLKEKFEK